MCSHYSQSNRISLESKSGNDMPKKVVKLIPFIYILYWLFPRRKTLQKWKTILRIIISQYNSLNILQQCTLVHLQQNSENFSKRYYIQQRLQMQSYTRGMVSTTRTFTLRRSDRIYTLIFWQYICVYPCNNIYIVFSCNKRNWKVNV